jgi:hypothetical protein
MMASLESSSVERRDDELHCPPIRLIDDLSFYKAPLFDAKVSSTNAAVSKELAKATQDSIEFCRTHAIEIASIAIGVLATMRPKLTIKFLGTLSGREAGTCAGLRIVSKVDAGLADFDKGLESFAQMSNRGMDGKIVVQGGKPRPKPSEPYPTPDKPYPAPDKPYPAPDKPYPAPDKPYPAPDQPYPTDGNVRQSR